MNLTSPLPPDFRPPERGAERGSALILSMFFMFIVSLAAVSMSLMVNQDLFMNRQLVNRARALEIANGALEQALGWVALHPSNTAGDLPAALLTGTFGADYAYSLEVTAYDYGLYRLLATGQVSPNTSQAATQRVAAYVRRSNYAQAFGTTVFSNGNLSVGGNYNIVSGGIHSNGNADVFGSAAVVGPRTAHGASTPSPPGVSGTTAIDFPLLDYDYYLSKSGIQVENGNYHLDGGSITPSGGILYVKGDLTVNAQATVNGMVIVTGSIKVTGQGLTVNPMGMPGMVAITGDIDLGGGGTVNGLIYTGLGTVTIRGDSTVNGHVIANGTTTLSGNGILNFVGGTNPQLLNDPKAHVLVLSCIN
ncbi:MAG: hypothetical protein WCH61_06025 [bacterium]